MFGIAHARIILFFSKMAASDELNLQLAKRKEKEGEKPNLKKKHVKIEVLYGKTMQQTFKLTFGGGISPTAAGELQNLKTNVRNLRSYNGIVIYIYLDNEALLNSRNF